MKSSVRESVVQVEQEARQMLDLVRDGKPDNGTFSDLARSLARQSAGLDAPELRTRVLEFVRMSKTRLFESAGSWSQVEVACDRVLSECAAVRRLHGEALVSAAPASAPSRVAVWGSSATSPRSAAPPPTWEQLQQSKTFYSDGYSPSAVLPAGQGLAPLPPSRRAALPPPQPVAARSDPARERALADIERELLGGGGDKGEFEAVAALSPRKKEKQKTTTTTATATRKSAGTARPAVDSATINKALPNAVGGLRVVK